jgi:hypothetical protein
MAATKKTNNDASLIEAKVQLRINSLPNKTDISVLEAFGGEGVLWNIIKRRCPDKKIEVLSIDKNKYNRVQLQGDNLKYIAGFDLQDFDIIDLDAWGSPVKQLEIVFAKEYSGVVHCTFIQSMQGNLPRELLYANGYTDAMLLKIKTIFMKNPLEKFLNYLSQNGVKKAQIVQKSRKSYLWFTLNS